VATQPNLRAQFPSGPLLDEATGEVLPVWRAYFASLYVRTGGAPGDSASGVQTNLDAEVAARQAGDVALSGAVVTERAERQAADTAEASARAAADTAEVTARTAADALALPKTGGTLTGPLTGTTATFGTVGTSGGATWRSGTGAPAGTAPIGSLYSRTDGAVGSTLYVSRGAGTWNPVAGV
jgi:membrane protein involved in colicin uptake